MHFQNCSLEIIMLGCLYTVNRFSVDKLIKDHLREFWGHPYNKQKLFTTTKNIQSAKIGTLI